MVVICTLLPCVSLLLAAGIPRFIEKRPLNHVAPLVVQELHFSPFVFIGNELTLSVDAGHGDDPAFRSRQAAVAVTQAVSDNAFRCFHRFYYFNAVGLGINGKITYFHRPPILVQGVFAPPYSLGIPRVDEAVCLAEELAHHHAVSGATFLPPDSKAGYAGFGFHAPILSPGHVGRCELSDFSERIIHHHRLPEIDAAGSKLPLRYLLPPIIEVHAFPGFPVFIVAPFHDGGAFLVPGLIMLAGFAG